jgi:hypothetical protein
VVQPWKRQTMLACWSVFHPLWYHFKCFNQICSAIGRGLSIALCDSLFWSPLCGSHLGDSSAQVHGPRRGNRPAPPLVLVQY